MIQTIKRNIINLVATALMVVPMLAPVAVHAQADIQGNLCAGGNLKVGQTQCDEQGAEARVNGLLTDVINIFSLVVGVVAVIMIIIGGLKYIMSAGDSGNITGAKNTILYAIIGLVIVAMAQFIVRFVIARVGA